MLTSPLERRITLHQLRIFKTVVDLRGVTRAAEALSLSQSAVTHQIQALARSMGHPLFHPGRRTLELTPVGSALSERAGRILALVRETSEALDDIAGLRSGSVRIAGDTTAGIYVLPDALAAFHAQHPDIQLSLEVVNRKTVRELLLGGDADLGVAGRLWEDDLLEAEPFIDNELACFSAPNHPLVHREPLEPSALLDGPLLLREPGSGTRESAEEILRAHAVDPQPAMQMASNGALKRTVAKGLGVTVLSSYAVRLELELNLLHRLQVRGFPVRRMWHVIWARERILSPAAQAFRRHLHATDWRLELTIPLGRE
ncbi:MAG TPA: LysR family transcriptional regulator [Candidatus Dormibacteraeota bacterium]|jgi:DNA-binding transcriptional LysR family regulator